MVWHAILLLLSPVAALVTHLMPDHRDREILALRQQVLILQRQLAKRPRQVRTERLALLLKCVRMRKQRLLSSLRAERLVVQIARENLHWGYTKIAGEVRKLGFISIGRSTVERILKPHGLAPRPHYGGLSWAGFLGRYGQFIWACDVFTVTTATLCTYQLRPPDGFLFSTPEGKVVRRKILGGLISDYYREAA